VFTFTLPQDGSVTGGEFFYFTSFAV